MLTAILAYCGTSPTSLEEKRRRVLMRGGADCRQAPIRRSGPATADLEDLALVLHRLDRAQHLLAELAVRLAIDFHRVLVLHDVARGRIDHDVTAWTVRRPTLERIDHLGAIVDLAVELFDRVEDGVHGVPACRRHEVRIGVRTVSLVPLFLERLILR